MRAPHSTGLVAVGPGFNSPDGAALDAGARECRFRLG